ncbi:hypothetical protein [Paracoccus homiensis]
MAIPLVRVSAPVPSQPHVIMRLCGMVPITDRAAPGQGGQGLIGASVF